MRIGLGIPSYGVDADANTVAAFCRYAENLGFDSLWTTDRLLIPVAPRDRYPSGDGLVPDQLSRHMDPLAALAFVAAHTVHARIGTSALNVLWQSPAVLARALATVDVLSGGRLEAGLGLGWSRDEYEAAAIPWPGRGTRLEETLDLLEKFWAAPVIEHTGPRFQVAPCTMDLKPLQRPRPPILLASFTPHGLRRVARRADGWLPTGMPVAYIAELWEFVRKEAGNAGRDPDALRMVLRINAHFTDEKVDSPGMDAGTFQQYVDYARAAAEAGIHEAFIDLGQTGLTAQQRLDVAAQFLDEVSAG